MQNKTTTIPGDRPDLVAIAMPKNTYLSGKVAGLAAPIVKIYEPGAFEVAARVSIASGEEVYSTPDAGLASRATVGRLQGGVIAGNTLGTKRQPYDSKLIEGVCDIPDHKVPKYGGIERADEAGATAAGQDLRQKMDRMAIEQLISPSKAVSGGGNVTEFFKAIYMAALKAAPYGPPVLCMSESDFTAMIAHESFGQAVFQRSPNTQVLTGGGRDAIIKNLAPIVGLADICVWDERGTGYGGGLCAITPTLPEELRGMYLTQIDVLQRVVGVLFPLTFWGDGDDPVSIQTVVTDNLMNRYVARVEGEAVAVNPDIITTIESLGISETVNTKKK